MGSKERLLRVMEGREKGRLLTRTFLSLLSYGYFVGLKGRHFYYDHLHQSKRVPLYTVSVGNIVCGGSGKTPLVAYLAQRLSSMGKVAICSRGYLRTGRELIKVTSQMTPLESGDEPLWLARRLPDVDVIVSKDRKEAAQFAFMRGANIAIFDDGMQQRGVVKDLEIVSMHASFLLGGGSYLPRGMLREDPRRLKGVDLIAIQGIEKEEELDFCESILRKYTKAPLVGMKIEIENQNELRGKKVAPFCAIAYSERFFMTLDRLGCRVVAERRKADHAFFSTKELENFAKEALDRGAQCLVCTEKDQVKLERAELILPVIAVRTSVAPSFGEQYLAEACDKIRWKSGKEER